MLQDRSNLAIFRISYVFGFFLVALCLVCDPDDFKINETRRTEAFRLDLFEMNIF